MYIPYKKGLVRYFIEKELAKTKEGFYLIPQGDTEKCKWNRIFAKELEYVELIQELQDLYNRLDIPLLAQEFYETVLTFRKFAPLSSEEYLCIIDARINKFRKMKKDLKTKDNFNKDNFLTYKKNYFNSKKYAFDIIKESIKNIEKAIYEMGLIAEKEGF